MQLTSERLETYYPFDEAVLAAADKVAEQQRGRTWREFLADSGMSEPSQTLIDNTGTEYIEFCPAVDYDYREARVFHAPMANPLDPNIAYQAATIFAIDPTRRLIAAANPSGYGYNAGLLGRAERKMVASGDLTPTVVPVLGLLARQGVELVEHIGGSYGAEKSMVAATQASRFGHEVSNVVAIEPPSVRQRNLLQLITAFSSTNQHMDEYIKATNRSSFVAARLESVQASEYLTGLFRFTNIAVAKAIAWGSFENRAADALVGQPEMTSTIAWGSESELAIDGFTQDIVDNLQSAFGDQRVQGIRLEGQHHAMGNDIHLQAALAMQSTRSRP